MARSTDLRAAIEEGQRQLREEQLLSGSQARGTDWATRPEQRVGALPWWMITMMVHAVVSLPATLLNVVLPPAWRISLCASGIPQRVVAREFGCLRM